MADMTLTLDKAQLLKELSDKRAEVFEKTYAKDIAELEDMLTSVTTKESFTEELAAWHKDIAEGLADERYQVSASGTVKGAPPKPKVGSRKSGVTGRRRNHYYLTTEADIKSQLDHYKAVRDQAVEPLDTAIKLLNMSKDSEVTISSGDYQNLLSGADRHGRRFW